MSKSPKVAQFANPGFKDAAMTVPPEEDAAPVGKAVSVCKVV